MVLVAVACWDINCDDDQYENGAGKQEGLVSSNPNRKQWLLVREMDGLSGDPSDSHFLPSLPSKKCEGEVNITFQKKQ